MARTCEEDRNWELGRIGAGEVELGNQIRGLGLGQPQLCSEAGTRPHAAPVLATFTSHTCSSQPPVNHQTWNMKESVID